MNKARLATAANSKPKTQPSKPIVNSNGQMCIGDLHQPVLPWRFQLLNTLLALPMLNKKFSVDECVRKACKMAGLSDFGDEELMPFREPLGIYLEDVNAACTTPVGKKILEAALVGFLVNRLKIIQLVKEHPEILDEEVGDPVVVVGTPRSGTTHLHRALAKCSAFRSLKMYEMMFLVDEGKELGDGEKDPRLLKCGERLRFLKALRPTTFKLHDTPADEAEEDHYLMTLTCHSVTFLTLVPAPGYSSWYAKSDKKPAYAALKLAMQVIQWQDQRKGLPKRPFLLKCSAHVEAIPVLMDTFPNAKLINTHRELKPVLLSLLYLLTSKHAFTCKEVDLHANGQWILDHFLLWAHGAKDCQSIERKRLINVLFKNYVEDYRGSLKKILGLLGVKYSSDDWLKIEEYLVETGKFQKNRVLYDTDAFGLDMDVVDQKLVFYNKFMEGLHVGV